MKRLLAFLFPRSRRTVTIVVNADESFLTELDSLAANSNCSKAEIIDRAIQLYAKALDQAKQGKVIEFSYPESSLMRGLQQARNGEFVDPPDLDEDLAIAIAERVEQGKEPVFTHEESIADLENHTQDKPPAEDGFVAVVNELATKTELSKAEALRNALNLYYSYVYDEALRLMIQAEIDAHREERGPPND